MSKNPRDTQFHDFAGLLLEEMLEQRKGDWINFNADDTEAFDEYSAIIARRAYDLVEHAISTMNPIAFQCSKDDDEIIHAVPDLSAWPKEESR